MQIMDFFLILGRWINKEEAREEGKEGKKWELTKGRETKMSGEVDRYRKGDGRRGEKWKNGRNESREREE